MGENEGAEVVGADAGSGKKPADFSESGASGGDIVDKDDYLTAIDLADAFVDDKSVGQICQTLTTPFDLGLGTGIFYFFD